MLKKIPINYISAFVIFIVVILWIFSGSFKNDSSEEAVTAETNLEELISVRAKNFSSQNKTYFLTVRGRTEADKIVLLKPKTTSTLTYAINKGLSVSKGEIICELDPENRIAALDEANASKNKAQLQQISDVAWLVRHCINTALHHRWWHHSNRKLVCCCC